MMSKIFNLLGFLCQHKLRQQQQQLAPLFFSGTFNLIPKLFDSDDVFILKQIFFH